MHILQFYCPTCSKVTYVDFDKVAPTTPMKLTWSKGLPSDPVPMYRNHLISEAINIQDHTFLHKYDPLRKVHRKITCPTQSCKDQLAALGTLLK